MIKFSLFVDFQQDFCNWETFDASCATGNVIMMTSALYGRMKMGRCIHAMSNHNLGCSEDILRLKNIFHYLDPESAYCNWETFKASCTSGHVVMMTSAKYGRMRMNRCFHQKTNFNLGCSADILRWPIYFLSDHTRAYCNWETFNATCRRNHVIMMTSAKYGRMKMSRCFHASHDEHLGCHANILRWYFIILSQVTALSSATGRPSMPPVGKVRSSWWCQQNMAAWRWVDASTLQRLTA